MLSKSTLTIIFATLTLATPAVQAVVLDFNNLSNGEIVTNQYDTGFYGGLTVSADNFTNDVDVAVIFDSSPSDPNSTNFNRDPDLIGPFDTNVANKVDLENLLIIQENQCNPDCVPDDEGERPAGLITFNFSGVIELLSIDFIDIERAENGATPDNAILLYDADDNLINFGNPHPFHTPETGNNLWGQVLFDSVVHPELLSIGRIDVYFGGSGALDNLTYNVVPLPASLWLFGTALLGFIGYSRRTTI